jgi:hypothetical protein
MSNPNRLFALGALVLMVALLTAACGGSDDDATTTPAEAPGGVGSTDSAADGDQDSSSSSSDTVDLTDQLLTATAPNCESYAGEYTSMITDSASGQEFDGMFAISATDGGCRFETNQIPNHNTGQDARFADVMAENDATLDVPSAPILAAELTELGMGASVIMLNGVKWEAYPAACFDVGDEPLGREAIGCFEEELGNPWRYNIGSPLNDFGFDTYLAHLQPGGLYHYHSTPTVLYDIECEGTAASPVIGFAADGFPVYGPCFEDAEGAIRAAASSYVLRDGVRQDVDGYTTPYVVGNVVSEEYDGQFIGDHEYVEGAGDLDECNGMTLNGQYGYYVTGAYPYVLACYSGTANTNFR